MKSPKPAQPPTEGEVLRRMLATKPAPHKPKQTVKKKKPKPANPPD